LLKIFSIGWVVSKPHHFLAGDNERLQFMLKSFYGSSFWNDGNEDFEIIKVVVRKQELVDFCRERLRARMQIAADGELRFTSEKEPYIAPSDIRITIEKQPPKFFTSRNIASVITFEKSAK